MSMEKSATDFADLSHKEQVFAFLSLIHPRGKEGAQDVFDDYDIFAEDGDKPGNPANWLFNLHMIDDLAPDFESVIYGMFCGEDDSKAGAEDDTDALCDMLDDMAETRECEIDWGGDVSNPDFRLSLGMRGLLTTAANSLREQGWTLWRDVSELRHPDGLEEYTGWMTQRADDAALLALCNLLDVAAIRCDVSPTDRLRRRS